MFLKIETSLYSGSINSIGYSTTLDVKIDCILFESTVNQYRMSDHGTRAYFKATWTIPTEKKLNDTMYLCTVCRYSYFLLKLLKLFYTCIIHPIGCLCTLCVVYICCIAENPIRIYD